MFRKWKLLFCLALFTFVTFAGASEVEDGAKGVLGRILGEKRAALFIVEQIDSADGKDVFEIETIDGKVIVRGSSVSTICMGANWYLKYYCNCSITWNGDQLDIPSPLPIVEKKIRIVSPYKYRYFFNHCTFSYTMAWWHWDRWERELDWMAMNGINMALSATGSEAPLRNTYRRLGFTDEEVKAAIGGPAWFTMGLMGCGTFWGGPCTDTWIDGQAELEKKILKRSKELGIEPVMQAFYGNVPLATKKYFPKAKITDTLIWNGSVRPPYLDPDDPVFTKIAAIYYEEQEKLYGKWKYFSGDLFHEGGYLAETFDLTRLAKGVERAMVKYNPESVWAVQAWQENPRRAQIEGMSKDHSLFIDLSNEYRGGWEREGGYGGRSWIWCTIVQFGARIGMFGNLDTIATRPIAMLSNPKKDNNVGLGSVLEASENNPIYFDLLFEMAWRTKSPDVDKWVEDFARRRYGKDIPAAKQAWGKLYKTVYTKGSGEFLFLAAPSVNPQKVNNWGAIGVGYDHVEFAKAWQLLLSCSDQLKNVPGYRYDLVTVTRQATAALSQRFHREMINAYRMKDKKQFKILSKRFLELIDDQDALLATEEKYLLGRWVEGAKSWANNDEEADWLEWMARTQCTVWGDRCTLRDYGNREWSGLLKDFYKGRWQLFINQLNDRLDGKETEPIDYYSWEESWTHEKKSYPAKPKGDSVRACKKMYKKYAKYSLDDNYKEVIQSGLVNINKKEMAVKFEVHGTKDKVISVDEYFPGWVVRNSGTSRKIEAGIYRFLLGRGDVIVTYPNGRPCVIESTIPVTIGKKVYLHLEVSAVPKGDWELVVKADGKELFKQTIDDAGSADGFYEIDVPIFEYGGRDVKFELLNAGNGGGFDGAYWDTIEIVEK